MGLAVTWCDASRRLMGRAAPRQQGPNEVRHRFSPPATTTISRCCNMTFCEMTAGRTSPARLMGRKGQSGSKLPAAHPGGLGGGGGGDSDGGQGVNKEKNRPSISSIDLLLTAGRAGEPLVTSTDVVWPQQHRTGLRRRPCPTLCTGGTCFYYYRSDTVMCQKAERVLLPGPVTDDVRWGKVAECLRWHLI